MIESLLKFFFKILDILFAYQFPSVLGFGHQIISSKAFDLNIKYIIQTVAQLPLNLSVLEIACGQGTLAIELANLLNIKKYTAIDIDKSAINKAVGKAKYRAKNDNLSFNVANFLDYGTDEQHSYDVIIADKFLHLLTEPEICQVLFHSNCLLKNSGILIINTVSTSNFVYSCTSQGTSQSIHRLLKNDIITRNWYNIKNPIISFITREWLSDNASRYGFSYDTNFEFHDQSNYLTVLIKKIADI